MNIADILKNTQHFVGDNAPAILTAIGVTGTVTTAVLAAKAGAEASKKLAEVEARSEEHWKVPVTTRDRVELTWKFYVPAAAVGTATVVCIVGANRAGARQAAAMATAYSVTERAFTEYKEKVVEQIGIKKEGEVRDAVAQSRVEKQPPVTSEIIITGAGEVLCYETISGRYFKSDMETIRKAQNDINQQIIHEMSASLNDFWFMIGLPQTSYGNTVGWNIDEQLDLHFSSVLEEGKPCLAVGYKTLPVTEFHHIG